MSSLQGVLARIPGLAGYAAGAEESQMQQMGQLRQMGALQQILSHIEKQKMARQAADKELAFREELQALGPQPDQESLARVAAKYAPASDILKSQTSSLDRRAQMDANRELAQERVNAQRDAQRERIQAQFDLAKQRAEDQALSRAEQNKARMEMMRLAASLRPEPQPRNLQLTTDESGNQLIVNPDGSTRPLTRDGAGVKRPVAADRPMTEFQGKAALYGTRSAQSDKVLKALEDKINTTGLAMGQSMGVVGNALMSSEQQRVNQAQRDFVNAVLRQESGAVISDAEFANAKKQYFPEPGDTPQVVAQKRANRQLAIQGFARMSGPKGAADIQAILDEPLLPGVDATAQTPQQSGGKVSAAPAKINSDAEFDALPSGATFIGPDGKTRKKP